MRLELHTRIAASLFVVSLLAACASEVKKDEPAPAAPAAAAPSGAAPAARSAPSGAVAGNPLNDPKSMLFKRSVYASALRHLAPFARQIAGPQAIPQPAADTWSRPPARQRQQRLRVSAPTLVAAGGKPPETSNG